MFKINAGLDMQVLFLAYLFTALINSCSSLLHRMEGFFTEFRCSSYRQESTFQPLI